VYVTGSVTGAIPGLMMPYFNKYVLQPENPGQWLAIFLAIYFGSGFLFLPVWMLLARRLGKKTAWLISFVPGITGSLAIFTLLGEGDLILTAAILVWTGSAFSAGMLLGPSIQADVIDYDELYTGRRREAQYNGLWSVMTKFTVIPSMAVPLAILAAYGYQPNVVQTEQVQDVIRTIFGLAPATTACIALLLATRFPIDQKVHAQIWAGIRAHQRGEPALDPLTQRMIPPPVDRGVPEDEGWFLDHFSPRELGRVVLHGPGTLLRSTIFALALSLGVTGAATWVVLRQVSDLATEPGVVAVFAVVVGGFAFAAACFHVFRVRAAVRMQNAGIPLGTIQAHLRFTEFFTGNATNRPASVGVLGPKPAPHPAPE
jgi:GPH family glycoside/pentoside/hexuronide:cation symporter